MRVEFFFNLLNFKRCIFFVLKAHSTGRSKGRITVAYRSAGFYRSFAKNISEPLLNVFSIVKHFIKSRLKADSFVSIFQGGVIGLFLKPQSLKRESLIMASLSPLPVRVGNTMPLKFIPVGTRVFNLDNIARSAGLSIQVLRHRKNLSLCKLPSKELKWINSFIFATVGVLTNSDSKLHKFYKAGQLRWLGRRPHTRGVAKNPIDHPHGGGQGKTSGGRPSVTPYAKLTKGYRTVFKKNPNIFRHA